MEVFKKREFENRVIKFFTDRIPEIKKFLESTYSDCTETEDVGIYLVLADIDRYFQRCVKEKKFDKVKKYFNTYWDFYRTFEKEYHEIQRSDTMKNLTRVGLFETIDSCFDEQDKIKVISLLPKGLKEDYILCTKS